MLCAHLNHYIDITKPIHPELEQLIFRYTEITEEMKILGSSPVIGNTGELLYNKEDWLTAQRDCILPKDQISDDTNNTSENHNQVDRITQWKMLNNEG